MKILAIETSCDESAIAIADFSGPARAPKVHILSNIVSSQVKLHAKFGGVVPNLARREHEKNLVPILLQALDESGLKQKTKKPPIQTTITSLEKILEREPELLTRFKKHILKIAAPDIDAIAVTYGPGLAPALWVGVNFARALSFLWKKPIIPTNHMAGHLYSPLLQTKEKISPVLFPALALLVSGGHTELVLVKNHGKYTVVGETLDDAAGEAFDKVARIMGLPYPGGPEISRLAHDGNPKHYTLPRPMMNSKDYNFSFSGLKTAVLYFVRDHKTFSKKDLATSFEHAVVDVLIAKTIRAAKQYKIKTLLLGGGVAANRLLRERLGRAIVKEAPRCQFLVPDLSLTGDNALMIALAAYFGGKKKPWSMLKANANLRLGKG